MQQIKFANFPLKVDMLPYKKQPYLLSCSRFKSIWMTMHWSVKILALYILGAGLGWRTLFGLLPPICWPSLRLNSRSEEDFIFLGVGYCWSPSFVSKDVSRSVAIKNSYDKQSVDKSVISLLFWPGIELLIHSFLLLEQKKNQVKNRLLWFIKYLL